MFHCKNCKRAVRAMAALAVVVCAACGMPLAHEDLPHRFVPMTPTPPVPPISSTVSISAGTWWMVT